MKIEMETSWRTLEAESVLLAGQHRAKGTSTIQIRDFSEKKCETVEIVLKKRLIKTVGKMACNKEEHPLRVTKPQRRM